MDNVRFAGAQIQSSIPDLMNKHDVLVLPSLYDGWGAVVNEALQQGLFVVCSDKCGARELLDGKSRGYVFRSQSREDLVRSLLLCVRNLDGLRNGRIKRKEWASRCISGEVISKYMVDCLTEPQNNVPWIMEG